jgi:hypothetical protein
MATGCSDYLNEPKPTDTVDESLVYSSREAAEMHLVGIAARARRNYSTVDSNNLATFYCARSLKGNDFILSNTWYGADYSHTGRQANSTRSWFTWFLLYEIIQQTNVFITGVTNSPTISDSDKAELIAHAKAWRAYCYFELSLEFNHTYLFDPQAAAPPLYTELTGEGKPMSTLDAVYDLILIDLNGAVDSLTVERPLKSFINLHVAEGLLARVYQVIGNWEGAAEMAHRAYGGNVAAALNSASYDDGFNDVTNSEWMWGMTGIPEQVAYWNIMPSGISDYDNSPYKGVFVNPAFIETFSDTDVRKTFRESNETNEWAQYVNDKFKNAPDADMVLMRTAEMILIEVEALYHSDPEAAHDLLYELQLNRDPNAVKSSNTGDELFEEILLERRKELHLETGVEWYDAKRLQRGITRDAIHRIPAALTPNDNRFILHIPTEEINSNDNIDESVNLDR